MPALARITSFYFCFATSAVLAAALPELSSIEPLEFDEAAQRLVARGDARLDFEQTRIRADRITYYQEFSIADADGNVAISRDGLRLLADRLSFDAEENVASVDLFRTGQWPVYLTGVTAGGTAEEASVQGATVYYGEPSPFGLSISSDAVRYADDGEAPYMAMDGATVRIGRFPILILPAYRHYLDDAPYMIDLNAGTDGELGVFLQTTTLFPVISGLRAGANLDLYSKRGVLAGPTAQYIYNTANQRMTGALTTGYIDDQGDDDERDIDLLGRPIDADRGFAEWRHKHHIGERFTATASLSYWSDSEVTRDFRNTIFDANERPDNFAEAAYAGDNFILSVFGRFRPNDFQLVQERLPEARIDLLPIPIFQTGAYQRASASYVRLRENFDEFAPGIALDGESDRFDLSYRIERPIRLRDWLTLTPLAGARLTHYDNQQLDPFFLSDGLTELEEDSFTRDIFELGFDLEARIFATYPTINETWDVDGLRHIVRPVLRYRYFSDPGAQNEIATIEREVFDLNRPLIDLSDLRNVDQIAETHLVRLGVENLFQTRAEGYGSRTLAALNFYQDILFEKGQRPGSDEDDTFDATWVEFNLSPAPWLSLDLASRFETETLTLQELRTRTRLTSGEIWEIGLSTDLLNKRIDQYRLDFIYRINERYALLSELNVDADDGSVNEVSLGLRTRIGSTWEVLYALTFRDEARRESEVQFNVQVRLSGLE